MWIITIAFFMHPFHRIFSAHAGPIFPRKRQFLVIRVARLHLHWLLILNIICTGACTGFVEIDLQTLPLILRHRVRIHVTQEQQQWLWLRCC